MKRLSRLLLDKSQDAFILGLETYNRPTVRYRVEAFCFMFCNAWELLLKARILEETKKESSLYYKKKRNQPRRSLSLRDCLKQNWPDEKHPIRRNVEDIAETRDAAVHFIVPELEKVYVGLLQSGVLNYVSTLDDWFGLSILDRCTPALLSLVADVDSAEPAKIKKKYGADVLRFFEAEQSRLDQAEEEISDTQYRIPIDYRLVLTKSPADADISLTSGKGDKHSLVVQVPKDLRKTHPHLQKDVIPAVNDRLPDGVSINQYDMQCFLWKNKVKGQGHYHHRIEKPVTHRYSEALVDFIVEKVSADSTYLARARESYKRRQK